MSTQETTHDRPRSSGRRWSRAHEEVLVAAVLLVGAVLLRLNLDDLIRGRAGAFLGPEFWPGTLLTIAIVLCAGYLLLSILAVRRVSRSGAPADAPVGSAEALADEQDDAVTPDDEGAVRSGSTLRTVLAVVLMGAYIWLLGPIGFVPATVLFSVAFLVLVGERRWWLLTVFPVAAVTVLLGIFTQLLTVSLPRGQGVFLTLSTYLY